MMNKRYQVTVKLGVMTEHRRCRRANYRNQTCSTSLSLEQIQICLEKFTGAQAQVPPMYSALKHNGKKLYELARDGITIEREPRISPFTKSTYLNLQLTR